MKDIKKIKNHFHSTLVFRKDLDQMNERQLRNLLLEVESLRDAIDYKLWNIN